MTIRLRLDLRYDGAGFHGWAAQDGLRTVEGELTRALETVLQHPVRLVVAGRTDSGVHAEAQVAHVDVGQQALRGVLGTDTSQQSLARFTGRLNRLLAAAYSYKWRPLVDQGRAPSAFVEKGVSDLVVNRVTAVSSDFDARFSALARHYSYEIVDRGETLNPLSRTKQWWLPDAELDVEAMSAAANVLLGCHDYLSFCKPRQGATTIRTLKSLKVKRDEDPLDPHITISVSADAFCHSMVRSLVGALAMVGRGKRDESWLRTLIASPSRGNAVPVAPARGLTLVGVDYPPEEEWATRSSAARSLRLPDEVDAVDPVHET